jgi:hypothetical protein
VGVQNVKGVFGDSFNFWEYYQDTVLNTYYYAVDFPLPEDLSTVHTLRTRWNDIHIQGKLLASLIEFADKFGANMRPIDDGMAEVDEMRKSSDQLYLEADYAGALEQIDNAIARMGQLGEKAVSLKDGALMWIYVIEWLAVTGVSMVCGVILWTLMIRKRLYKEVKVTTARV